MADTRSIGPRSTRRRFLRRIGLAAGALALALAVVACGGSGTKHGAAEHAGTARATGPVRGGTLISSLPLDIVSLDYAAGGDIQSAAVVANCVEPLLTVDAQGQPAGLLAESWESPDGRTYIFKLRPGITFQDGTDFNAGAVEYSLNRIRANKASALFQQLAPIDRIETPDPTSVTITLGSPFAPFLANLAGSAGRAISPAIGERYGRDRLKLDLTGAGTGPFKFVEWKAGDHVTLVRNERYWGRDAAGRQLPYLDKLVYRVIPDGNAALASLRTGELDVLSLGLGYGPPPKDTANVKADPSLSYRERPGTSFNYLLFNEAKEPFGSREVRQAISYAVDRAAMAHGVWFDTALPLDVIFTPATWASDVGYHPYLRRDLGRARQLLAQAGKPNGFACTLLFTSGAPINQQGAELIKDQLNEIGIDAALQQLELAKELDAFRAGAHQIARYQWLGGPDPDSWVYPQFSSKGGLNAFTHYRNPAVDRLLEQARATLELSARKPLYQQAEKLIMADAPICVLYAPTAAAISTSRVHDVPLGPTPAGASQVWKTA